MFQCLDPGAHASTDDCFATNMLIDAFLSGISLFHCS